MKKKTRDESSQSLKQKKIENPQKNNTTIVHIIRPSSLHISMITIHEHHIHTYTHTRINIGNVNPSWKGIR